jgi:dienelactone hydrolase
MKLRLITIACLMLASTGCASLETRSNEYIVIKPFGIAKPVPTVIMAHGCEGFSSSDGLSYRNRASLIAQRFGYNVILYDAFKPRGWFTDEVCTGARGANANAVPPVQRVEDTKQIARWVKQQSWHTGKISFIGYSHGGSVALAIANDQEASKLVSSAVAYYPNCDSSYIGSHIDKPLIPTLVHLGEADNWTPMAGCIQHKDKTNYQMAVYKNATHAWESGFNGTAIEKWPIRFNLEATHAAEMLTQEFFNKTLILTKN